MEEADLRWLGEDMIQRNGDRITVPPEVAESGIVEPGEPVFWAVDDDGVVLSRRREFLESTGRFRLLGESTVDENRELTLPPDVTSREGFDAGDILHFVASDALAAESACWVMTEDASADLF